MAWEGELEDENQEIGRRAWLSRSILEMIRHDETLQEDPQTTAHRKRVAVIEHRGQQFALF